MHPQPSHFDLPYYVARRWLVPRLSMSGSPPPGWPETLEVALTSDVDIGMIPLATCRNRRNFVA